MPLFFSAFEVTRRTRRFGGTSFSNDVVAMALDTLKGVSPTYYLDFLANRAIIAGSDVGKISTNVTFTSGTLNLSDAGHTIASTANVLVLPVTISYPITVYCELVRSVDTGGIERYYQMDDGTEGNRAVLTVSAVDAFRPQHFSASVNDMNIGTGVTAALSTIYKTATRYQSGSGNGSFNGSIATDVATIATATNPTTLRLGAGVLNVEPSTSIIRKIALIAGAQTNAQLQALTL